MSLNRNVTPAQGKNRRDLIDRLKEMQQSYGYLSGEHLVEIAGALGLPVSEVYGVATFYSFLSTRPQGRHIIRVCQSLPCYLTSNNTIIDTLKNELGIQPGETTADGRFSLELTNCIGACDQAPAMMIDNDVHGELNPAKIARILREYE